MKRSLPAALLLLFVATGAWAANSSCLFERAPVGAQKIGSWIDKSNWLAIENQRLSLQAADVFMPSWRYFQAGNKAKISPKQRQVDTLPSIDPLDGSQRDIGFLLDSRLYADGLVVLRNGQIVTERYRNGLVADKPRLLLDAARPWLNMLGAISISQGKLNADKSVVRYLPNLAASGGLRKLSIQRLLEDEEQYGWTQEELDLWHRAAGWTTTQPEAGVRAWLTQPGRWDRPLQDKEAHSFDPAPEDDLLAWTLAESNAIPLSQLFCEQLLSRSRPEHPILWLSDSQGVELASGLALSLRDFAKLGQVLVEARSSRNRGKIPGWFIETLTASSGLRTAGVKGLAKGSELRYGFVHLGGAPNRIALIGQHGTSIFVDLDRRLVIALYATRPGNSSAAMLATLEEVWNVLGHASAN